MLMGIANWFRRPGRRHGRVNHPERIDTDHLAGSSMKSGPPELPLWMAASVCRILQPPTSPSGR